MRTLVLLCCLACGAALRLPAVLSRRSCVSAGAASFAALSLGGTAAYAVEEPSRMGGILEPYIDAPKGFKLLKPSGWNKVRFLPLPPPFACTEAGRLRLSKTEPLPLPRSSMWTRACMR